MNYHDRCQALQLLKLSDRRKIAAFSFFYRAMTSQEESGLKCRMNNSIYDTTGSTRIADFFKFIHRFASIGSPLFALMTNVNELNGLFDLNQPIETNKKRIKAYFSE